MPTKPVLQYMLPNDFFVFLDSVLACRRIETDKVGKGKVNIS